MPQLQLPMFPVGVTHITSLLAFIKEEGARGFYKQKNRRGAAILTPAVIEQVQQLLSEHEEVADIAAKLDIKADTLSKAIRAGRLHKPAKKKIPITS